jgi:hypothetical protein
VGVVTCNLGPRIDNAFTRDLSVFAAAPGRSVFVNECALRQSG